MMTTTAPNGGSILVGAEVRSSARRFQAINPGTGEALPDWHDEAGEADVADARALAAAAAA